MTVRGLQVAGPRPSRSLRRRAFVAFNSGSTQLPSFRIGRQAGVCGIAGICGRRRIRRILRIARICRIHGIRRVVGICRICGVPGVLRIAWVGRSRRIRGHRHPGGYDLSAWRRCSWRSYSWCRDAARRRCSWRRDAARRSRTTGRTARDPAGCAACCSSCCSATRAGGTLSGQCRRAGNHHKNGKSRDYSFPCHDRALSC